MLSQRYIYIIAILQCAHYAYAFLKTAYVHFRLPSLVERAHIPWESISARLPVSLLYTPVPLPLPLRPSSTISLIRSLSSGTRICPLAYILSRVLHLLRYRVLCIPPLRGVKQREAARRSSAAICLWWMWFKEGEQNTATCLSPFGTSATLFLPPIHLPRVARLAIPLYQPLPLPSPIFYQLPPRQPTYLPTYLPLPTPPSFLYPGSYISPKSTHNYKTFNLNVKLKRNGFSSASTVTVRNSRPISLYA